jgi:hypothetical protein
MDRCRVICCENINNSNKSYFLVKYAATGEEICEADIFNNMNVIKYNPVTNRRQMSLMFIVNTGFPPPPTPQTHTCNHCHMERL